ncbi:carbon-nitrogen hydrolase family protein [Alteromonas facilis]|uniref:carbon-nitrogen hydrolase family protein n=1 Tax=Alteromonas facilis TaxID=2048004 RepID=UPI000C285E99|nr:carbon-nitrogen hydrolase family protein [Alteromonas facilis]
MAKLAAIQMISTPDVGENFAHVEALLRDSQGATRLVVLPECFALFGAKDRDLLALAKDSNNQLVERLQQLARRYKCWLVAGTIPILSHDGERFRAACVCIDDNGNIVARYDKIHLFDVQVADATGSYLESRFTEPGDTVVTFDSPFGKVGVAVCYDVRFAGLFQAMQNIDVLVLPSAFTQKTGEAHWHPLLQARSIELQCYVVASNQGGTHQNGRQTYGNSVIYSPWGKQLAFIDKGEGYIEADMDKEQLSSIRQSMPIQKHNRFRSTFVEPG